MQNSNSNIYFDENKKMEIAERLDLIYTLKRKDGNNIQEILEYKNDLEKEIQQINRSLHKWGDGTMNQMEKGMISIYQVWYEEQIDSILKFNLRKTNIKIDEE